MCLNAGLVRMWAPAAKVMNKPTETVAFGGYGTEEMKTVKARHTAEQPRCDCVYIRL